MLRRLRCGVFFAPSQRAILRQRLPAASVSGEASLQAGQGGPAARPGAVLAIPVAPTAPARLEGRPARRCGRLALLWHFQLSCLRIWAERAPGRRRWPFVWSGALAAAGRRGLFFPPLAPGLLFLSLAAAKR